jgi:hypothetical protein
MAAMKQNTNTICGSYEKWLDAQNEVSDFEKQIFEAGHHLTEDEMSRLRALRHIAASHLRQLVCEFDAQLGRPHRPHEDRGALDRSAAA